MGLGASVRPYGVGAVVPAAPWWGPRPPLLRRPPPRHAHICPRPGSWHSCGLTPPRWLWVSPGPLPGGVSATCADDRLWLLCNAPPLKTQVPGSRGTASHDGGWAPHCRPGRCRGAGAHSLPGPAPAEGALSVLRGEVGAGRSLSVQPPCPPADARAASSGAPGPALPRSARTEQVAEGLSLAWLSPGPWEGG